MSSFIDDIWGPDPKNTQSDNRHTAVIETAEKYSRDIQMLAAVVQAIYFGAIALESMVKDHTANEYYQSCMYVLLHEGISEDKLMQATLLLTEIDAAIKESK